MEEHQQLTLEAIELQTGHYSSLIHALAVAMTRCVIWCYNGTDQKYNVLQLYRFAEDYDKEHPVKDCSFYMVTNEGAIGISPGKEYLTKWMFIPEVDEASIEKLQSDIRQLEAQSKAEKEEELARKEAEEKARQEAEQKARMEAEEKARREAEEKARREAEERARREAEERARLEAEQKAQQSAAPAAAAHRSKFCQNCGTPYKSENAKFCANCGTPRK